jgi:eukaryotic-like serine/threonine-protein kinase
MTKLVRQQLGNYRLLHLLGQGGFADVYQGEHIHLKSLAAIKVLHTRLSTDDMQEEFLREAQILARLSHPHIIRILDFGIENALPFLVMEFAPHGTLRQLHPAKTRVPLETVASYVKQISAGLQFAHEQKLIHRDLKPENILISQRNELLLSDFGVALLAQTTRSLDQNAHFAGTASYMAPEQFQGRPRFASDQYSLAVMAYEWLCGERPFNGTLLEVYSQHQSVDPPALRSFVSELPPEVEQIILTALLKDPERRFGSIKAFSTALEQASKFSLSPYTTLNTQFPSMLEKKKRPLVDEVTRPVSFSPILSSTQADDPVTTLPTVSIQPQGLLTSERKQFTQGKTLLLATLIFLLLLGSGGAFFFTRYSANTTHLTPVAKSTTVPPLLATQITPTPTQSAAQSLLPYTSTLSAQDEAGWDQFTYAGGGGCAFSGGAYHSSMPQNNTVSQCLAENISVSDFSFQVQMTLLRGDGGGLIFRSDTKGDFYRLRIGSDGTYDLVSQVAGIVSSSSGAIIQGYNKSNTIKVIAQGNQISLYVNGQILCAIQDKASSGGRFGVFAVNFGSTGTEAVFSNAQVNTL